MPTQLLVIGRQGVTEYAGRVDLLCLDQDGRLYVVDIRKERTPREVVAHAMDYGYWVRDLGYEQLREIYGRFRQAFQLEPPGTINSEHQLVIVASALDAASERIVTYAQSFGLQVNVVFFQTFEQNGSQYLTRTWLIDAVEEAPVCGGGRQKKRQAPWNGKDWYLSFGEGESHNWEDARRHGYVCAGRGRWYSGTLKKLPVGGRVFVNLPGRGHVGGGIVTATPTPLRDFNVQVEGQQVPLAPAPNETPALTDIAALDDDDTEWFLPVRWVKTLPREQAIRFKGRYGNQNSATRLTGPLTRETVLDRVALRDEVLVDAEAAAEEAEAETSSAS